MRCNRQGTKGPQRTRPRSVCGEGGSDLRAKTQTCGSGGRKPEREREYLYIYFVCVEGRYIHTHTHTHTHPLRSGCKGERDNLGCVCVCVKGEGDYLGCVCVCVCVGGGRHTPSQEGVRDSASFNQLSQGHFVQKEKPNKTREDRQSHGRCVSPGVHPRNLRRNIPGDKLLCLAVERTCGCVGGRRA